MNSADISNFINELDAKDFYKYMLVVVLLFLIIIGAILYFQHSALSSYEARLKTINKQRVELRSLLQEHGLVNKQREAVDAILSKDKAFRISNFFDLITKELGLSPHVTKDTVIENDLGNGYVETQLDASFKDMDMKQVTDLLYKIEQSPRMYTKNLVLLKTPKSSKLDVTLVVATLQPKTS